MRTLLATVILSLSMSSSAMTETVELKPLQLPKPQVTAGKPLMQVLKDRSSLSRNCRITTARDDVYHDFTKQGRALMSCIISLMPLLRYAG
jgi:hypothetical protein